MKRIEEYSRVVVAVAEADAVELGGGQSERHHSAHDPSLAQLSYAGADLGLRNKGVGDLISAAIPD